LKHLKVKPNNSKTILIEGLVLVKLKVNFLFSEILSLLRKQIKSIINKMATGAEHHAQKVEERRQEKLVNKN